MTTTCQEVLDQLEAGQLAYSEANARRIGAALRKLARVTQTPLDALPADPAAFRQAWGKGRVTEYPTAHFRSAAAFRDWRSSVHGALERATGTKAARAALDAREDGWCTVLARAAARGRSADGQRAIAMTLLARLARADEREPKDISREWLLATSDRIAPWQRRSFKDAVHQIDTLRSDPACANVLPADPVGPLPKRRPLGPARLSRLPSALQAEAEPLLQRKGGARPISGKPRKPRSEATYLRHRAALGWYVEILERMALVSVSELDTLDQLADPVLFVDALRAGLEEAGGAARPSEATLRDYAYDLACDFDRLAPGAGLSDALAELIAAEELPKPRRGLTPKRRQRCQALLETPAHQRRFFDLPWILYREATALLTTDRALAEPEERRLRQLATVAAALAILVSAAPLRRQNLIALTVEGAEAQLREPVAGQPARLRIPGDMVKNGRELRGVLKGPRGRDPWQIVRWHRDHVRPRILTRLDPEARIRARPYLFPAASRTGHLTGSTFQDWLARYAAEAGLPMTPHEVRHFTASLMLYHAPGALSLVAARLGNTPAVVERHYAFIDADRMVEAAADILGSADRALRRGERKARGRSA